MSEAQNTNIASNEQQNTISSQDPNLSNKSFTETIKDIVQTPISYITGDNTISPINKFDTNTYIIALNKSSNVLYLAICTLIIGVFFYPFFCS